MLFRMVTPRFLNRLGVFSMALPLCTWLVVEVFSRSTPDCHLRIYGESECFVGGFNLGIPLLLAGLVGIVLFFCLTVFVAFPLFILAAFLSRRAKKSADHAA